VVAVCWVASGAGKKVSVKEKNFKRLALKSMEQSCCDSKKIEANMLDPKSRRWLVWGRDINRRWRMEVGNNGGRARTWCFLI
jgi:hypothetical protein